MDHNEGPHVRDPFKVTLCTEAMFKSKSLEFHDKFQLEIKNIENFQFSKTFELCMYPNLAKLFLGQSPLWLHHKTLTIKHWNIPCIKQLKNEDPFINDETRIQSFVSKLENNNLLAPNY
jgi:hypothetical protein